MAERVDWFDKIVTVAREAEVQLGDMARRGSALVRRVDARTDGVVTDLGDAVTDGLHGMETLLNAAIDEVGARPVVDEVIGQVRRDGEAVGGIWREVVGDLDLNRIGSLLLDRGDIEGWNKLRQEYPDWQPCFSGYNFNLNISLAGADFSGAHLPACTFYRVDLTGACFDDAKLMRACFDSALLADASFQGADLEGATLKNLRGDMNTVNWTGANMEDVRY